MLRAGEQISLGIDYLTKCGIIHFNMAAERGSWSPDIKKQASQFDNLADEYKAVLATLAPNASIIFLEIDPEQLVQTGESPRRDRRRTTLLRPLIPLENPPHSLEDLLSDERKARLDGILDESAHSGLRQPPSRDRLMRG
jgi:hypothetical protein